ncbi:acetyltransferase, ribosomal protein N-acetylase [Frankia sp. EI5c]|uniref:phosphopantetheine-binding protein n=1 Tax=Frankia sp. EI5c TaxID=683316 RepID=UPI0007C2A001|nr:phosphopantetheine-binding protein [Frankia sp. EI5c]OAA18429.1 acetyltransferase, ribosomal protein N-acetylase [Frankia sp. EI5c]
MLAEIQLSVVDGFFVPRLGIDPGSMTPATDLRDDLGLDSLQRLDLYAWLVERGADPATIPPGGPRTVAESQALLDAASGATASQREPPVQPTVMTDSPDKPRARAHPPLLHTSQITLRPVGSDHVPFLYHLAIREDVGYRWRFRGAVPDTDTFQANLRQGVLSQFVVVTEPAGEPAGSVICYNADLTRGIGYIAAAFTPEYTANALPVGAVSLFVRYVFQVWNLRKLYLEMISYNYDQIASGAGRYFDVEGRLSDHSY